MFLHLQQWNLQQKQHMHELHKAMWKYGQLPILFYGFLSGNTMQRGVRQSVFAMSN
jgi:hypothetical protein